MSRRALLSSTSLEAFFHIPADVDGLRRHDLLSSAELDLIRTRRRGENRFGLAVHPALPGHPGQGWLEGTVLPPPFIDWLGEKLHLPSDVLTGYAGRGATRTAHHMLAIRRLDLTPFTPGHAELATEIATPSAVATDDGVRIVEALITGLEERRLVLPGAGTIERLALKGRARARREAADVRPDPRRVPPASPGAPRGGDNVV